MRDRAHPESSRKPRARLVAFGVKGPSSVPGAGGVERGIEQLAPLFAEQGFDLVAYARASERRWWTQNGICYRGARFVNFRGMAHWTHAILSALDYLSHRDPSDVIYVHSIDKAFLCVLFSLLRHRVIFVLHGREWRASKWGPVMRRYMKLSRRLLRFADVVVSVCQPSLAELRRDYPRYASKLVYLPNGLPSFSDTPADLGVLEELGVKRDRFFLYAGRLVPQKRVDLIVEALASSPPDAPLVVAGSHSHTEDYVARLRSMIRDAGLGARVRFAGQRPLEQLVALYSACRAVVLPSETEGCSQTILEAIACCACLICSDLPENHDVAGDAAIYFAVGDGQGLREAMRQVRDDATMRDYRGRAAARRKELPSWREVAARFGELST